MATIRNLCNRVIYLKNGVIAFTNETAQTINYYLNDVIKNADKKLHEINDRRGSGKLKFIDITGYNGQNEKTTVFLCGEKIRFKVMFDKIERNNIKGRVDIGINNQHDIRIAWLSTSMFFDYINDLEGGITFEIDRFLLSPGSYTLNIYSEVEGEVADWLENVYSFEIAESDFYLTGKKIPNGQGIFIS